MCWRMRSLQKSTRILECGIYRTDAPGVEVRAGYGLDGLLQSQRHGGDQVGAGNRRGVAAGGDCERRVQRGGVVAAKGGW